MRSLRPVSQSSPRSPVRNNLKPPAARRRRGLVPLNGALLALFRGRAYHGSIYFQEVLPMTFTPIDPASWPQMQTFYYFSQMAPTGYSLTVELDVTALQGED